MKVSIASIRALAQNSGLPDDVVDRYTDQLVTFAFTVATKERKVSYERIKKWMYVDNIGSIKRIDGGKEMCASLLKAIKWNKKEEPEEQEESYYLL
jgi:hypothetical protein